MTGQTCERCGRPLLATADGTVCQPCADRARMVDAWASMAASLDRLVIVEQRGFNPADGEGVREAVDRLVAAVEGATDRLTAALDGAASAVVAELGRRAEL